MEDLVTSTLITSPYGFSAASIDDLGASEYTLVSIAQDVSGSVGSFSTEMEKCIKSIVEACMKSPRADNLMLRLQTFDSHLDEVHGFKPLGECNSGDYDGCLKIGGMTALLDASVNAIEAIGAYGKDLVDNDYDANGILFVITDGFENNSTNTINQVKETLNNVNKSEALSSLITVLIGVNVDQGVDQELQDFNDEVGFDKYIGLSDAEPSTLAKIAEFMTSSISSQSDSLINGAPPPSLYF